MFEQDGVTDFTFTVYPGIPSSIPVSSNLSYETLSRGTVSIIIVTLAVGETLNSNTLTHNLNQFHTDKCIRRYGVRSFLSIRHPHGDLCKHL